MHLVKIFIYLLTMTYALIGHSQELLNLQDLENRIHAFIQEKVNEKSMGSKEAKITIRALDTRLRLKTCDRKLTFHLQSDTLRRHNTIKVSCDGTHSWSIFSSATLKLYQSIVALKHELPRQHILTEADLIYKKYDIFSLRNGYSTQKSNTLGQQLKRSLRMGEIVYNHHLQLPDIVSKGDKVRLTARMGGLSVITHRYCTKKWQFR